MERMDIVRREADSPEARGVALSRRSFIEVAVGTLAALPVVNGGLALPLGAEKAHAIETTVVTAKANEAAIVVMDMAGNKQTPVAGAHVVLKVCGEEAGKRAGQDPNGRKSIYERREVALDGRQSARRRHLCSGHRRSRPRPRAGCPQ